MNFNTLEEIGHKERVRQGKYQRRIFCCTSTACHSAGAGQVHTTLDQAVAACMGDEHDAEVVKTGCMGLCSSGPLVRVDEKGKDPILYGNISPDLAMHIVSRHVPMGEMEAESDSEEQGQSVTSHDILNYRASLTQARTQTELDNNIISFDLPFFTKQVKAVLNETGRIDPDKLEDYLAHGGYKALAHVLEKMTPEDVCSEILQSGLRGRGGAGFPTGLKWNFVRQEGADKKFVIVNGDEGDPGAFMDRTVMEDDPHRVLEGMIICAYAVGASYGYLYIRGEYPMAIDRIRKAIRAAKRRQILSHGFLRRFAHYDITVVKDHNPLNIRDCKG